MRACALRLFAAVGFAALNAWLVACGDELPVDDDLSRDGGVSDGAADAGEDLGTDSGAEAAAADAATCDDCERLVFVTNAVFDGNLGGVLGADEKCRVAAAASPLANVRAARSFKAWISATDAPASKRLAHGRKPYLRVDGTPIAKDWSELIGGTLTAPIGLDESGKSDFAETSVWTGTTSAGELLDHCMNWTLSDQSSGYVGSLDTSTERWTRHGRRSCYEQLHLYCIQE